MDDRRLLKIGIVGTVVAALCCFTPVLVVLLGAVGLSAVLGWLDYVLLPALAIFIGIVVYALVRQRRGEASASAREGPTGQAENTASDRFDLAIVADGSPALAA